MRSLSALVATIAIPVTLAAQASLRSGVLIADRALSNAVFADGPGSAIPAALGPDGILVWPGAAVLLGGVPATRFFAHEPLLAAARISWQPFRIEIAPDSSLALLAGVATLDRPATDPIPLMHRIGRYLAVWKRVNGTWRLNAFALVNIIANGETIWTPAIGAAELPVLHSSGPAGDYAAADSAFAFDAGGMGLAAAFERWAAADAMTFTISGELNIGPDRIGAALAGTTVRREWTPVAAGASADGSLGWTVGQATVMAANGGAASKTKYITFWRRQPDGTIRFIVDGGSARP